MTSEGSQSHARIRLSGGWLPITSPQYNRRQPVPLSLTLHHASFQSHILHSRHQAVRDKPPRPARRNECSSWPKAGCCCYERRCVSLVQHIFMSLTQDLGGMGVIGGIRMSPAMLQECINDLKEGLEDKNAPFGVDLAIPQIGGNARKTNVTAFCDMLLARH